jgi:NAD(P)-dependent dehydrogenase (short-subunit alcohol dehydrogenase family)
MAKNLEGQVALVTGASSGLGRHFAQVLAEAGARVAITGRRTNRLKQLKDELQSKGNLVESFTLDVLDVSRIGPTFDEIEQSLGPLDILVNNAGMSVAGPAADMTPDQFDTMLGTNLRGPFFLATQFGRRAIERKASARIVNIASIGSFKVLPGSSAYCISKAALAMMTRCLAREWARFDIAVNAICPGYIETELTSEWFSREDGQRWIQSFPRKRLLELSQLDDILLLLASAGSAGITGSLFTVDDGQSL